MSVGVRVLEELGLSDRVEVAALAKQFEEVFVPGRSEPIRIPRDSEAIYLLEELRDEAHRFAIGYHREVRARRMRPDPLARDRRPRRWPAPPPPFGVRVDARDCVRLRVTHSRGLSWLPDAVADAVFDGLHPDAPELGRSDPEAQSA